MAERCDECYRPIKERAVIALDKRFHPDCFVCTVCKKPFSDGRYVPHKNRPYCRTDYEKLCTKCDKVISSGSMIFNGEKFHVGCLKCNLCRKTLLDGEVFEIDSNPFCKSDYDLESRLHNRENSSSKTRASEVQTGSSKISSSSAKAAPSSEAKEDRNTSSCSVQKCEYCGEPVSDKKLIRGLRAYHEDCFKCSSCFNPIQTEDFTQGKFGIVCSSCSAKTCSVCKNVIGSEDKEIEFCGDKMHADCLKCTTCHRVLNPKDSYQFRLKPYCMRDYSAAKLK
eukprot:TRINITY_DN12862_c0_g1_i1.p1 TRINITY_DN12862_c0_g1~~TRINITY_DN12862_c0_g1_i1.p1  ORF type:complete len:281 (-),score=32.07 TRINITY_DN12862_c0_g1_i1:58-900(-)